MNRRDLLKTAIAAPVAVAVAPLIAAEAPAEFGTADATFMARYTYRRVALGFHIDDGVALTSMAHPGSVLTTEPDDKEWEWDDAALSDDSLEEIEIEGDFPTVTGDDQ